MASILKPTNLNEILNLFGQIAQALMHPLLLEWWMRWLWLWLLAVSVIPTKGLRIAFKSPLRPVTLTGGTLLHKEGK